MSNDTELAAAWLAKGRLAERSGDTLSAITMYERAVAVQPQDATAWTRLGVLQSATGATGRALAAFEVAALLIPESAAAAYNLGRALTAEDRVADAVTQFRRALSLRPIYPEAYLSLFATLPREEPTETHLELCRRALLFGCRHAFIHQHYGEKLHEAELYEEAIDQFALAKKMDPSLVATDFGRGNALHALGRYTDAIDVFENILAAQPHFYDARVNRGIAEAALGRNEEALANYQMVISEDPNHAAAHRAIGIVSITLRHHEMAIVHLRRALELNPQDTDACAALGEAYAAENLVIDALQCFRHLKNLLDQKNASRDTLIHALNRELDQLITLSNYLDAQECCAQLEHLDREIPFVLGRHALVTLYLANWRKFLQQRVALIEAARVPKRVCAPFTLLMVTDDPGLQKHYAEHYMEWGFGDATPVSPPRNQTFPRKIRIGYVSPDFRDHPVGHLVAPLFESHNRERFEVIGFSVWVSNIGQPESSITRRIRSACDDFVELGRLDDVAAAKLIRDHQIDILVDLAGHTSNARTGIFSLRPAPVQVNYLGYPGTMGGSFYDYIIGDQQVTPHAHSIYYTEQIVQLAGSYLPPGDRTTALLAPSSRESHGLPRDAIVLGAFHTTHKIMPEVFEIWLRLLVKTPRAVLWLKEVDVSARAAMIREADQAGIEASRLVFADGFLDSASHLARLQAADLLLDTFPYGSHSAAMDALWAGVPILTCQGDSFASRVCAGLLTECGLTELVATSLAQYERIADTLISNPTQLSALRSRLEQNRSHPIFDAKQHAAELETAYAKIWVGQGSDLSCTR
jgi:predicted O-linked N-acetylglucosamine transferase (SPINDLY family)